MADFSLNYCYSFFEAAEKKRRQRPSVRNQRDLGGRLASQLRGATHRTANS